MCSFKTTLIDWKFLRALYTPLYSNVISIVKETKIGQSAAKLPSMEERSTTIESIGKLISEEASRVDSSESKRVASHFFMR